MCQERSGTKIINFWLEMDGNFILVFQVFAVLLASPLTLGGKLLPYICEADENGNVTLTLASNGTLYFEGVGDIGVTVTLWGPRSADIEVSLSTVDREATGIMPVGY